MSTVLESADEASLIRFQEVVLLAALFNDARVCGEVDESFMVPPVSLLVKAFACALDNGLVPCDGEVINTTRDVSSHQGVSAKIRFSSTKETVDVKTWIVDHSWLCLPEFDIWIDLLPPGSDPRWISPVKYFPGKFRPAYRKCEGVAEKKKPKLSDIRDLSKYLSRLLKERGPNI